jgi:hypothetical protein
MNNRIQIAFQPFIASMDELVDSLQQFMETARIAICQVFGIPSEIIFGYYRWERYEGEPFMEWSERLFNRNLLDDPNIRREYQAELWRSFSRWITRR